MQTNMVERVIAWLGEVEKNRVWLADQCGCSPSTITRILNDGVPPSLDFAIRLEDISEGRLKCRDWVFPSETNPVEMVGS